MRVDYEHGVDFLHDVDAFQLRVLARRALIEATQQARVAAKLTRYRSRQLRLRAAALRATARKATAPQASRSPAP